MHWTAPITRRNKRYDVLLDWDYISDTNIKYNEFFFSNHIFVIISDNCLHKLNINANIDY